MSKKKIVRILSIALMISMIAMSLNNVVLADTSNMEIPQGDTSSSAASSFSTVLNKILGVVQIIGVAVAVIMLIVLAIKYISAAPGDKAEIKKHAVVYVVGAVILFAASGILQLIRSFSTEAFPAGGKG